MAQFTLHHNANPASSKTYPYLLDIQSDLLSELKSTVVIPLSPLHVAGKARITRLSPTLEVHGAPHIALTQQLAGIDRKALGKEVEDFSRYRHDIIAALDFMISGI